MANSEIPGLSWAIRQSLDREEWQHGIYNEEFLERLMLTFGHPQYFTDPNFGVVSETQPAIHTAGSAYPLVVSRTTGAGALTVDINPGMAVTKSGVWAMLHDYVRQVPLANTAIGIPNVVYLAYTLQPADNLENDFTEPVVPLYARTGTSPKLEQITGADSEESEFIRVDTVETYLGYVASVSENFVPLAIVTVQDTLDGSGATVTSLAIDHTQDTYTFNRPWFSAVDIEHRSQLNNPHEVTDSQVTSGNFTRFQLSLTHGMVIAKDQSIAKVPGSRCEAVIPTDQLFTDDSQGTNTGFPNKKYYTLPNFPIRLGKCWIESTGDEVGAIHRKETTMIVFPGEDPPTGEDLHVYYTKAVGCEPPVGNNNVNFETSNPTEHELVVAGGQGKTALNNTQVLFSDAIQFPMFYEIFVGDDGALRATPQVVYCYNRLDVIGTSDEFTIDPYGPGKILVGLTGASGLPGMVVELRVYGKDVDGVDINELYTFDSTWSDVTIPMAPPFILPTSAFKAGIQVFDVIDSITIENTVNEGPNAAIMIWSVQTPYDTYDHLKDACHVSSVVWNGTNLAQVLDKRIVECTDKDWLNGDVGVSTFEFLLNVVAGNHASIYVEDFRRPVLHSLEDASTYYDQDPILKVLPKYNFNKLQVHLEGAYRTKALPVFAGSGSDWHASFVPQAKESGLNNFVSPIPRFRYKTSTGWSSWVTMVAVAGVPGTFTYNTASDIPIAVQVEIDPYPYVGMAIYG